MFTAFAACFLGTFGVCLGLVAGNKICGTVLGLYGVGILSYLGYVKYQDYQDRKAYEEHTTTVYQLGPKTVDYARAVLNVHKESK